MEGNTQQHQRLLRWSSRLVKNVVTRLLYGRHLRILEEQNMLLELYLTLDSAIYLPTLTLPKRRLDFVDDGGGGGFWICAAVGARDWRMEYVRCMIADVCKSSLMWILCFSEGLSGACVRLRE